MFNIIKMMVIYTYSFAIVHAVSIVNNSNIYQFATSQTDRYCDTFRRNARLDIPFIYIFSTNSIDPYC